MASERQSGEHPRPRGPRFRAGPFLVDAALIGIVLAAVCVFLGHNGFIGHHDVQPFPY